MLLLLLYFMIVWLLLGILWIFCMFFFYMENVKCCESDTNRVHVDAFWSVRAYHSLLRWHLHRLCVIICEKNKCMWNSLFKPMAFLSLSLFSLFSIFVSQCLRYAWNILCTDEYESSVNFSVILPSLWLESMKYAWISTIITFIHHIVPSAIYNLQSTIQK